MGDTSGQIHWTAPAKLTGLKLSKFCPTDNSATVVWNQPDYTPNHYIVKLLINGGLPIEKRTSLPCHTIKDLRRSSRYCVQVLVEENQYRAVSELLDFVTAPAEVLNITIEKTSQSSCIVQWDKTPGAKSYIAKLRGGQSEEKEIITNDATFSDLPLGSTFLCSVAAKNQAGIGVFSETVKFDTDFPGPQQIEHKVNYAANGVSVEIRFQALTGQDISKYHIRLTKNDEHMESTVEGIIATFQGIEMGTRFTPSIVAETVDGSKSRRAYGECFWTKPDKVLGVKTNPESKTMERVRWRGTQGAESYIVHYGHELSDAKEESTRDCNFLIKNLPSAATFFVHIIATNCGGRGEASDVVFFKTVLAPPQYLELEDDSDGSTLRFLTQWEPCEGTNKYNIVLVNARKSVMTQRTTEMTSHVFTDLKYGTEYYCKVQALEYSSLRHSSFQLSKPLWTRPPQVTDLIISVDSPMSRSLAWKRIAHATYVVRVQRAGHQPQTLPTEQNEHYLKDLQCNSTYTVSVRAKNQAGEGEESERKSFQTALDQPQNVRVVETYKTSIGIRFDEPEIPARRYQIRPIALDGTHHQPIQILRREALMQNTVTDLEPGCFYQIAVCSLHEKEELNSEEVISNVVQTRMPALVTELRPISRNSVKITWNRLHGANLYKVFKRIENTEWQIQEENGCEVFFRDLQHGTKHEFKVTTVNSHGDGEESGIMSIVTAPDAPHGLKSEFLSPKRVKISCNPVMGADMYTFYVNENPFRSEQPNIQIENDMENETLDISVCAASCGKSSPPSDTLSFQHSLLHLKRKFQKNFKNTSKYIAPKFRNLEDEETETNLDCSSFCINQGESCLILGESSSGKTATCYEYLQNLPNEKLGIYLDYSKFRNQQSDVQEVLSSLCDGIQSDHAQLVLIWMKSNSKLLVFIIDNFDLPSNYEGRPVKYDEKAETSQIFYNLISTRSAIFPDSQVLFTSRHEHIKPIVNPSKALEIIGFGDAQIQDMARLTLREEAADTRIPENIKYFCVNPGYCDIILRLIKNSDAKLDLFSSIMVATLEDRMKRYPIKERMEKLRDLLIDIEKHHKDTQYEKTSPVSMENAVQKRPVSLPQSVAPSVISEMPSICEFSVKRNLDENTCKKLYGDIVKALFYSYFCSLKVFKSVITENIIVPTIAAGLLRKENMHKLKKLLEDKEPVEAERKMKHLKQYIKANMAKIQKKVYSDHVQLLNWLEIIAETGDKDLANLTKMKIKIDDKLPDNEITEVAEFLGKINKKLCCIEISYSKDVSIHTKCIIDDAIKRNPEENQVDVGEKTSRFFKFGSIRRRSSPSPADISSPTGSNFTATDHQSKELAPIEDDEKSYADATPENDEDESMI